MFGLNTTVEEERYNKNLGIDMKILNAFAYTIELFFLSSSFVIMIVYLVISRLNRRFHCMLRILLNFLCFGMLINNVFRIFMVPVRLFLGRSYKLTWIETVDNVCRTYQLFAIFQIDMSAFLISIERLIATLCVRRYEHMFTSFTQAALFSVLLGVGVYGFSYWLFVSQGDAYESRGGTLMIVSYVNLATNLVGFLCLRMTQRLSLHHLTNPNHELSKSFQCRENICVVRLISPVCILLFVTRLCQFAFRIYVYFVLYDMGAFMMRMFAHMYNLSLALSVFLTPTLLIVLQPKLLNTLLKRKNSSVVDKNTDTEGNTAAYFDDLKKTWAQPNAVTSLKVIPQRQRTRKMRTSTFLS